MSSVENKEPNNNEALLEAGASATLSGQSLDQIKELLNKTDRHIDKKQANKEKAALKNRTDSEKRLADAKAKMQENSARAEQKAEDRLTTLAYDEEYRKKLMARKKRNARLEKRQRDAETELEQKKRAEAAALEIEEFVRRERELQQAREQRAAKILASIGAPAESKNRQETETEKSESAYIYGNTCADEESIIKAEDVCSEEKDTALEEGVLPELSNEIQNTDNEENDTVSEDASDDLIIKINPNPDKPNESGEDFLTLKIAGTSIAQEPSQIVEEMRNAEDRHRQMYAKAITSAGGVTTEEVRLVDEENRRYNAEMEALKIKLYSAYARIAPKKPAYTQSLPDYYSYNQPDYSSNEYLYMSEPERESYLSEQMYEPMPTRENRSFSDEGGYGRILEESEALSEYARYQEKTLNREKDTKLLDGKTPFDEHAEIFSARLYPEEAPALAAGEGLYEFDAYREDSLSLPRSDYRQGLYSTDEHLAERGSEDKSLQNRSEGMAKDREHIESIEKHLSYTNATTEHFSDGHTLLFARGELIKRLNAFYKSQRSAVRKIAKIEAKQRSAAKEENIALIVEKIGVQKELCELSIEALSAAVYADVRGKTVRQKRVLEEHIDEYNLFCEEYERACGRPLQRLSRSMALDVLEGRICKSIPNVYYQGSGYDAKHIDISEDGDKAHRLDSERRYIAEEYERYLEDGAREGFSDGDLDEVERQKAKRMSEIRYATERDVLMIGLRNEYLLSSLEAERDILTSSFGIDKKKKSREIALLERKIEKAKIATKHALKLEREDNSRFYLLPAIDPRDEKLKGRARRERLNALRIRLNVLLSEREDLNERLIALYGGSDGNLGRMQISRKASAVRKKSAMNARRQHQDIAKTIERLDVPEAMKEEAFDLLNQKIRLVATAEEIKYKLRKSKISGPAHKELVRKLRRTESEILHTDREIKYTIRRRKKYEQIREDNKQWTRLFIFVVVLAVLAVGTWIVFGDGISAYFADLASKFRP